MTRHLANCPNCGAHVEFIWSSAVQTTCAYCRSILVRRDVDLERVGEVGDLPPTSSPIQLGTEGRYGGRGFVAVGRIIYEHERGAWNEWHLYLSDGSSGWLADAQAEYAVSFVATAPEGLPPAGDVRRGQTYRFGGAPFTVTTLTRARYRGVEGQLPFEYWDKDEVLFVDLRTSDGRFATIDYSEVAPLLFVGESVEFDRLALTNLRRFEGW